MPTILDYYKYAKLANAAYVLLDDVLEPADGATIAALANQQTDASGNSVCRIPLVLGQQIFLFDPVANPSPSLVPLGPGSNISLVC